MRRDLSRELILSVYPSAKGIAFVVFEGPDNPIDWGVKEIKGKSKNRKTVEAVERIIERYQPEVLVIEDTSIKGSRRTARVRRLYRSLAHLAKATVIEVRAYPQSMVRKTFAHVGASTKYEVALAIARMIPAFKARVPRVRKPWMSQDSRQSLFDAVALGMTYYAHHVPSPYHAVENA